MLRAVDLHKDYRMGRRTLTVLGGVSVEVREGELLAIVGPSGAGKSTLLHLLGLLDTPTSGEIYFDGIDLTRLNQRQQAYWRNRLFGFVFQFYHLLPDFNAIENVMVPALAEAGITVWRTPRRRAMQRARELLEMVGLGERTHHRPAQLSGGERQRVAIARALVNEPSVLLCDEPTGNLDTRTGAKIMDLIQQLRRRNGCTVIMATHDERVASHAERVVHMVDGRLVDK